MRLFASIHNRYLEGQIFDYAPAVASGQAGRQRVGHCFVLLYHDCCLSERSEAPAGGGSCMIQQIPPLSGRQQPFITGSLLYNVR
jgi:hypothetical protein